MSASDKVSDLVKEGESWIQAAWNAAHKLVADTQTHPAAADKPAAPAAKPQEAAHKDGDKAAAAPKASDNAHAPAAKAQEAAHATPQLKGKIDNITGNKNDTGKNDDKITAKDVTEAKSAGMSYAASFLADALLPGMAIVDAGVAVYNSITGSDASKKSAEAQAKTAAEVEAKAKAGAAATGSASATSFDANVSKHFAKIEKTNNNYSIDDFVKDAGCTTSNACKADPSALTSGSSLFSGMKIKKADDNQQFSSNAQISDFDGLVSKKQWATVFKQISKDNHQHASATDNVLAMVQRGEMREPSGGTTEHKGAETIHRNAKGEVDWVKNGEVTRKKEGHIFTEINSRTHEVRLTDEKGNDVVTRTADGKYSINIPGTDSPARIEVAADGKTAKLIGLGKISEARIHDGFFERIGNTVFTANNTNGGTLGGDEMSLATKAVEAGVAGLSHMDVNANGGYIRNPDGTALWVGRDRSAGIVLSADLRVGVSREGEVTVYRKGQQPQKMTEEELKKLRADHPAEFNTIKKVIDELRTFINTGELQHGDGQKVSAMGDDTHRVITVANNDGQMASGANPNAVDVKAAGTPITQHVDLAAKKIEFQNAAGQTVATIGDSPEGKVTVQTSQVKFDGNQVVTNSGEVIGNNGVKFADGTNISYNGVVTDKYGTTYDDAGEIVAIGTYSNPSGTGRATGNEAAAEGTIKNQVAAAESIAASIRGRAASGHCTAGDIAALQGSMASLGVLVSSLGQFTDSAALASAIMAQDDVAGAIDLAMGTMHTSKAAKAA